MFDILGLYPCKRRMSTLPTLWHPGKCKMIKILCKWLPGWEMNRQALRIFRIMHRAGESAQRVENLSCVLLTHVQSQNPALHRSDSLEQLCMAPNKKYIKWNSSPTILPHLKNSAKILCDMNNLYNIHCKYTTLYIYQTPRNRTTVNEVNVFKCTL